ncbi:MAG: hypothetical protein AAGA30_18940, partial [Planctomycetota bacterium]
FNLENLEFNDSDSFEADFSESQQNELVQDSDPLTVETEIYSENANLLAGDQSSFEATQFEEFGQSVLTNEISGRSNSKSKLLRKYGGNSASESAVELALEWLADHQDTRDGGWWLDHQIGPKVNDRPRTSPDPGQVGDYRIAATSLALLPFLANGQTHRNGKYKKVVFDGLSFLMNADFVSDRVTKRGLDYRDDRSNPRGRGIYSHGLATLVFTECYAMTRDEKLRDFALGAIKFIEDFQDPVNGGWRYERRDPGDTSVLGWQVMALKSGRLCGFELNKKPFNLAKKFLKDVSLDYGAYYGYADEPSLSPNKNYRADYRATTAVGLLCSMYLGVEKENKGITKGVEWLSKLEPDVLDQSTDIVDVYYNYHATQVLKHYGGEKWTKWNSVMRDFLIDSQSKDGPSKGSWFYDGFFNPDGGRLYTTSLCCLTLEVYYRYLPLFKDDITDEEFILD